MSVSASTIFGLLPPSSSVTRFKLLLPDACWINLPTSVEPVNATAKIELNFCSWGVHCGTMKMPYLCPRPNVCWASLPFCRALEWHLQRRPGNRPPSSIAPHTMRSDWFVRLVSERLCCRWLEPDRISRPTSTAENSTGWFGRKRRLAHVACTWNSRHRMESFCLQIQKWKSLRCDVRQGSRLLTRTMVLVGPTGVVA